MSLDGLKSRCRQTAVLLKALGENLFSCLFQNLEEAHIPWQVTPCSIFRVSRLSLSEIISLTFTFLFPSSTFKGHLHLPG